MVVSAPAVARRCRQLPSFIKPSTSIQTRSLMILTKVRPVPAANVRACFRAHSFTCADANSSPPARLLSTSLILSSTPQWEFSETCLSQARHVHSHNSCASHFFQPRFTSLKRLHSYNLVSTISSSSSTQTPTSPTTKAAVTNTATNAVDATVSEDSADESPTLAAQCLKPRSIFPWRHSPYPLPRLVMPQSNPDANDGDGTGNDNNENKNIKGDYVDEILESEYFTKGGPLGPGWPSPMDPWFRASLFASSMHVYGVPWYSIIFPWTRNEWIDEMEWSFCEAFSMGVNGMIEDTYCLDDKETAKNEKSHVSAQDEEEEVKDSDDFDVNLDTTIDAVPLLEEKKPHAENNKNGDEFNHGQDQYYMLQKDLRQMYESAKQHSNPSKINIVLRLQPQYARIESMFPVFGLDRQLVQDHPALRHSYRNLVRNLQRKHKEAQLAGRKRLSPIEVMKHLNAGLNELIDHTAEMTDDKKAVTTIIAQVSIQCKEIFCVRDVESGEIFQGDDDGQPRDVTHLVRFEICIKELEDGEFDIGRWQITDWDDLLHGNVWFT